MVVWCGVLVRRLESQRHEFLRDVARNHAASELRTRAIRATATAERIFAEGSSYTLPELLIRDLRSTRLAETIADVPDDRSDWRRQISHQSLRLAAAFQGGDKLGQPKFNSEAWVECLVDEAANFDTAVGALIDERQRASTISRSALDVTWNALTYAALLSILSLMTLGVSVWTWRTDANRLRAQAAHSHMLVESARDLIWGVDVEGNWTFLNRAAKRVYGHRREDMLGRPFWEFASPENRERDVLAFRALLAGAEMRVHYESTHVHADGRSINLMFSATPMRGNRGEIVGVIGTATDVTYRREMQDHIVRNEKLQSIATLGGGIAHDFNNLLTVILGQAEVTAQRADVTPPIARRLRSIIETGERARKLTQQLLAFARRQPLSREIIDLGRVVRQMTNLLGQLAGESVIIEHELPSGDVSVLADWGQIEQVIINLVVNARDAMPKGGSLCIRVAQRTLSRREARAFNLQPGVWAEMCVEDDGEGIPPDVVERIFDPFFTTKEAGKGTGLGLATVHGVIHQHGGTIRCESELGKGTLMRVLLPISESKEPRTDSSPAPMGAHAIVAPSTTQK